jgi:serine phosphatase RsbU (regulator of sigma subunit)
MNRLTVYLLVFFIPFFGLASNDSLLIKLKNARNDSARIELLYKAANSKKNSEFRTDSLLQQILTYSSNRDCFTGPFSYLKVGTYYAMHEKSQKALDHLLISLKKADSCNDPRAIMHARYRIAYVNKINEKFVVAIKNAHYSLKYARQLKDSMTLADNYTLLGNIYKTQLLLDSALSYHYKALEIRERLKDETYIALTYNNLGLVYKNKKEYDKALYFLRRSLALKIKVKDKTIGAAYNNLSIVFKHQGRFDSAIIYSQKVINESLKTKSGRSLKEALSSLAEIYDAKKDFVHATHYYKRLKYVEDSVGKDELNQQYLELQSKYESDKKDADLKLKEDSLKLAEAQNSRKNILILFSGIALLLGFGATVIIFRSYRKSKKLALQLSSKNKLIEEKNKEITDSINYARNIQQSLLSSEQVFTDNVKEHFILYLPKDIVSGDFYWAEKIKDEFILMCGDCTGHGVPGAFMSLLGISYLKEIIYHNNTHRPDQVLNELRNKLIEGFTVNDSKDGMDASLVKIKGYSLEMAAANNPVWIIRNNNAIEIKPNKFPIGKHYGDQEPFTLNSFELQENDLVILFTDGFSDQFGGPQNKKYKYKRFKEFVVKNSYLPLAEQKEALLAETTSWRGRHEQIDDILVIGIRV